MVFMYSWCILNGTLPDIRDREYSYCSFSTNSHCAFPSNLFHRQITQKPINQMSSQEDLAHEKFLEWNHPQPLNAQTRGCLNITLKQQWHFVIFQISAEKSLPAWQKKNPTHFCIILCVVIFKNYVANPLDSFNICR